MDLLGSQIAAALEEGSRKRKRDVEEGCSALVSHVNSTLDVITTDVRNTLTEQHCEMEERVNRLMKMAGDFATAVDTWQKKASDSVCAVESQQQLLWELLQDVEKRAQERKKEMLKRQEQRMEELRTMLLERIQKAEASMQL
ncbi:kinetoplastid kinetochore protein 16 [Trypanosoma equiperdum]|uniref:Kinetoplastid kinetochore protein 16 n=4 Tax=Trypanozoon TaxID=39700 RepID=Q387F0_TRYB2|nr:hypothetical protein, conserved [Trypanosoma brucei gambiense DAL972]XP_828193.1 hypothetical protein, conserved [Trypanosoma brucei brucei TREU927]RHW68360.1 kinetoplastid kinetochore protein 16 [Trypanosoma brucei equiperdum]SCU67043.1 kinetoplastid kinetochore protein 16 [Trypanosoma equiperdum]EAN79081.1 hypothetical protein, conserved [Trypanosoma brucei brucei TREU927]CBH16991.1 hypothetical protein, conserved [Trypanosoma brucei gambiense DAL972]|eukprot:XP_011779255.1 hypothetical protein, conserved [Trypanosoma brucei gambiense DAL972]